MKAVRIDRVDASSDPALFAACARIHRHEIQEGFLASLGDDFLHLLYRTIADAPAGFLFLARDDADVLGFICGSEDTHVVYRQFARRAGIRALAVLLPRIASPKRVKRVIETLVFPSRRTVSGLPRAEILNFCVTAAAQGRGVGRRLFEALVTEFRARDVTRIRIVTGEQQRTAQRFYEAAGARRVGAVAVHKGSPSVLYVLDLDGSAAQASLADSSAKSRPTQ